VWENFHVDQVFRSDPPALVKNGAWWLSSLLLGGLAGHNPRSLLDRKPLRKLITARLPCEKIQKSIDDGVLRAFGVTASGYGSGQSVTFFQGHEEVLPWSRVRRVGCQAEITIDHLMASSSLPFVFEAVKLNREYFGDGSMRQMAPLSAALHMGAERLLVIGVRQADLEDPVRTEMPEYPSMAHVAGHALNSIFLDSLDADLERLLRINKTVSLIPDRQESKTSLRRVETLVIAPSRRLDEIAAEYAHLLPRTLAFMFRGFGVHKKEGSSFLSYLLFEQQYCQALMLLGYNDALAKKESILSFLHDDDFTSPEGQVPE
jgi:NTE family protein